MTLAGTWDPWAVGTSLIFNLVVNAVIHASAKRLNITAEGQGPVVVLRVTNRGVPIPAEMQDSIFDPFVSTKTASASALTRTGLGLGLFIVREIVNGHDGTSRNRFHGIRKVQPLQFRLPPRRPRSNIPPEATTGLIAQARRVHCWATALDASPQPRHPVPPAVNQ